VILVVDTSASTTMIALLDGASRPVEEMHLPARSPDLVTQLRRLVREHDIDRVAVATGPGSFTGLRVGVSFALGLAMGKRIPIVPLPTLAIQQARSSRPATAVVEAGRGRFYYLTPEGKKSLGEPADIPATHDLVGAVSPAGKATLEAAGHALVAEAELRDFGRAAGILLETAREVAYGSLEIEYMQSFSAHR
jgi:tRNA threonylcarbamoyladenosine biosynthesis protein TsaB